MKQQQRSGNGVKIIKRKDQEEVHWELPIPANDNLQAIDLDVDVLIAENDNDANFDLSETGLNFTEAKGSDENQAFGDPFYSGDMPRELDFTDNIGRRGFLAE
ncbi:MAG: hypothetical protein MI743_05460 [Sneathiellales bacterium]|nr:hypothetical protein [Sneathiellales bacterium]